MPVRRPTPRTTTDAPGTRPRVPVDALLALAIFLVACWQFLGAVDDRPMHRDEARWIHRAVYIRELAHPLGAFWDEETWIRRGGTSDEQYRLRAQPPMGSYVMGLGFLLQGRDLPDIGFWNMDRDDAWNIAHDNQPSPADITTGRRTSAIAGALTVVAVYFIGARLTNRAGGAISALFLAVHPLMIYLATFAGSDAVLALTIALAAVAAYRLADRPTPARALLLGVMLGLGGATKLSPLGVTAPLALLGGVALLWALLRTHDRSTLRLGLFLLTVPLVTAATFIASYPYLWRDPLGHTRALVDYREWGMDVQGAAWPQVAVETRVEALRRVGVRLGHEWTTFGRISEHLGALELAITLAGALLLAGMVVRRGLFGAHALAAAVLASQAAITIYGLRVDWARYHLPILLLVAAGVGVAGGKLWTGLKRLWALRVAVRHRPMTSPRAAIPEPSAD
jgi:hypothetical protein